MRRLARVFEPPKVDLQPAWEKTLRDAEKLHGKYQRVVSGEAAAEAKQALQAKVPVARRTLALAWAELREALRAGSPAEPWDEIKKHVGRILVCSFFFSSAAEKGISYRYELARWHDEADHWAQFKRGFREHHDKYLARRPGYPVLNFVVVPAALLCICNVRVTAMAALLTADMVKEDVSLLWSGFLSMFGFGQRPTELMVKKMGMLGCMLLVLANAARAEPRDAMAGALLCAEAKLDSRTRSALLLAARVLMGLLLLYVGSQQLYRAGHRSELWTHEHDPNDAHDSHWLLVEMALSLPFLVGYQTDRVCAALALTLAAEAFTLWPFWRAASPRAAATRRRRRAAAAGRGGRRRLEAASHDSTDALIEYMHALGHFGTNLSVAGGLLLLQGVGAGAFSLDAVLHKKRRE